MRMTNMANYLFQASYSAEGVKGLLKEGGTSRRAHIEQMIKGMGGSLEAFYYAFGSDDVIVIAELPDDASAAAISLAVGASGGAAGIKTTVLITPETLGQAAKKTVGYRPAGQ
jgi:uncharacterized protein with GYD domain